MAAIDAFTADWITVSSDVLFICVAMVGVSVITTVDIAAAGFVIVVVTPSAGKRTADSRLIRSGLEPVDSRSKRIDTSESKAIVGLNDWCAYSYQESYQLYNAN